MPARTLFISLLLLVVTLGFGATGTNAANILFISSMDPTHKAGDDALKTFMEGMGHTVTYLDDDEVDATFTPGALEAATTYYWRVDEIAPDNSVRTGAVWTFTTCLPVDDFEGYNDEPGNGTCICDVWIDGYANGLSGSTVGYPQAPFAERTIVHSGKQSMPLDYNNVKSPFYSEAEREFAPVQDFTINDVSTLVLHVQGKPTNTPAPLSLGLEDASRRGYALVL